MDSTEKIAEDFLKGLGLSELIYEPDGNIPPDFSASSNVAVEVRRLNQLSVDQTGAVVGLEQANIPIWRRITKFVNDFGTATPLSTTYGIFYEFSRPIPAWKTLQSELSKALTAFASSTRETPQRILLPCGVSLRIFDWKKDKGSAFRIAGCSDRQAGGWIVANLQFALQHAIAEKEAKTRNFRASYPEWWLVLIDYVSFGTDEHDRRQLFENWRVQHTFDKVYVVNPRDLTDYFEI